MKIYEYIKGENERIAKIFGFPIIEQTSDYMTTERHQRFFGGLVTTSKVEDNYVARSEKDIKIFGMSVIKRVEENNCRNYYVFNKRILTISLIREFEKRYRKYFDQKYDDIYILNANSGETYLTLTYIINTLIKRNTSKRPLLVATQKYHIDIIKMVCPDIPYLYLEKLKMRINKDSFKINNFNIYLLYNFQHFKKVETDIKTNPIGQSHYFKSLLNRLNMTENDITMNKIVVPFEVEQNMLAKVQKTGLNIEKFVFLAPEAQSCKLYDEDFWILLNNKLQERGYDVFVNLVEENIKLKGAVDFKTCTLSFAEAFALAKRAKKIVSLRSGLTDFLLQTETPIDVLYTKFRHRHFFDDMDIDHVMAGFGLTQIPFIDKSKIREFNMSETSPEECITKILKENI